MRPSVTLRLVLGLVLVLSATQRAWAAVRPHGLFTDNAVLQRKVKVPVWGTTDSSDKVTVSFAGQQVECTPQGGEWKVELDPLAAGGPHAMTIAQGDDKVEMKNMLVGDVWLCGGQSNMQWTLSNSDGGSEAIASSANDKLRLITVPRHRADEPKTDVDANWVVAGPQTTGRLFRRGLFLRPRPAKRSRRARGVDFVERRRHGGRRVDQQADVRVERGPGRHVHAVAGIEQAVQRHDRAAGALRDRRSHLVPGRVERRASVSLSQAAAGHDRELARHVRPGRLSFPDRADCSL